MKTHLRTAVVLGLMGAISVPLVFPYLLAVMPSISAKQAAASVSLSWVIAAQTAQAFVVLTLLSWIGLRVGAPLGLGAPLIRWLVDASFQERIRPRRWLVAATIGVSAGIVIVLLDLVLKPMLPPPLHEVPGSVERWKGFMACFYGGVTEELLMRLFVMTLLVWAMARAMRRRTNASYVLAIALSALIFGAGHLPLALQIWGNGFVNVSRTLVLNAIAGAVFGWMYWRYGLEHAMLAHLSADIVLHVVAPI
jgi:membrane protease YdiL (CAAX protease family)